MSAVVCRASDWGKRASVTILHLHSFLNFADYCEIGRVLELRFWSTILEVDSEIYASKFCSEAFFKSRLA